MKSPSNNTKLNQWVQECTALCQPDSVYWCDGSTAEYNRLMNQMVASAAAIPMKKRPNSFLFRADPSEINRAEDRTRITTPVQVDAVATNNWIDLAEIKKIMVGFCKNSNSRKNYHSLKDINFNKKCIDNKLCKNGRHF